MRDWSSSRLPIIVSLGVVLFGMALFGTAGIMILGNALGGNSQATPTSDPLAAQIIIPTSTTAPSATPIPPTPTATATDMPTVTATASATLTNAPTNRPLPTNTPVPPTITNTPAPTVDPYLDSRITNVSFSVVTIGPKVNDAFDIIFRFSVTNANPNNSIRLGHMGPLVYDASGKLIWEQWSFTDWEFGAGNKLDWEDHFAVHAAGTYTLKFTICFSQVNSCDNGTGEFKVMAPPITITVQ